jgi:hypothetical protein
MSTAKYSAWKDQKLRHLRAPVGQELVLANGQVIASLNDLSEAITSMDWETHIQQLGGQWTTNDESEWKNDYADWVEDAFGFVDLADELREIFWIPDVMKLSIEVFLTAQEFPILIPDSSPYKSLKRQET